MSDYETLAKAVRPLADTLDYWNEKLRNLGYPAVPDPCELYFVVTGYQVAEELVTAIIRYNPAYLKMVMEVARIPVGIFLQLRSPRPSLWHIDLPTPELPKLPKWVLEYINANLADAAEQWSLDTLEIDSMPILFYGKMYFKTPEERQAYIADKKYSYGSQMNDVLIHFGIATWTPGEPVDADSIIDALIYNPYTADIPALQPNKFPIYGLFEAETAELTEVAEKNPDLYTRAMIFVEYHSINPYGLLRESNFTSRYIHNHFDEALYHPWLFEKSPDSEYRQKAIITLFYSAAAILNRIDDLEARLAVLDIA